MVVLWIVLTIILVVVTLLAIPLSIVYTRREVTDSIRIEFQWLFGVVHGALTGGKRRGEARKEEAEKADKGKDAAGKKKKRFALPPDVRAIARRVLNLLKRIMGAIELTIRGNLYLGLPDPADTGVVWGMSLPFITWIEKHNDVRIYPHFLGMRADLIGTGRVTVIPLRIVIPVVVFIVSPQGRALLRQARKDV